MASFEILWAGCEQIVLQQVLVVLWLFYHIAVLLYLFNIEFPLLSLLPLQVSVVCWRLAVVSVSVFVVTVAFELGCRGFLLLACYAMPGLLNLCPCCLGVCVLSISMWYSLPKHPKPLNTSSYCSISLLLVTFHTVCMVIRLNSIHVVPDKSGFCFPSMTLNVN